MIASLQVKILSHVDDFRMRIFAGREPELGILQVLVRAVSLHGEILFLTVLQFDADGNRLICGRDHQRHCCHVTLVEGSQLQFLSALSILLNLSDIQAVELGLDLVEQGKRIDALQFLRGRGGYGYLFVAGYVAPLCLPVEPAFYSSAVQVKTVAFQPK